jgi:hypothetical protein
MCSLEEAWHDFNLTKSAQGNNNLKYVKAQQTQLDLERNPNNLNLERLQQDQSTLEPQYNNSNTAPNDAQYYSQSTLQRDYSRHAGDVFRPEYDNTLMSKPPSGNSQGSMIRGIHNKYSREKRVNDASGGNDMIQLSSSIEAPGPLPNTLNNVPNYISSLGPVDGKPYREGPPSTMPDAHNSDMVNDNFLSVNNNYFANNSYGVSNDFTPEVINNASVLNDSGYSSSSNSKHNTNPVSNVANVSSNVENTKNVANVSNTDVTLRANEDQIKSLKKQLDLLNSKFKMLETKLQSVENNRPHDIILIIVISLFILFIVDNIFRSYR